MAQPYAAWAEEADDYLDESEEPMAESGELTTSSGSRAGATLAQCAARVTAKLRADMRKQPYVPSEEVMALAGCEPGEEDQVLGMRLRRWAERNLESYTDEDTRIVCYLILSDHVNGHRPSERKAWRPCHAPPTAGVLRVEG